MNFDAVRIVLVATSHPGNIGSTARAMKTMGFKNLYLVAPKTYPHLNAHEMAAGADDVLAGAIITHDLDDALQGCQLILGTSARPRGISLPGVTPFECAKLVCAQPKDSRIALLFGREHAGLTNEELLRCHYHIHIPSNPEYASLNLAQAVQVVVYELRMRMLNPQAKVESRKEQPLAKAQDMERFYEQLYALMVDVDFLKPNNPRRLMQRLRRLFNRAKPEAMELNILRGVLAHIQKAITDHRT